MPAMRYLLAVALLAACTDETPAPVTPTKIGEVAVMDCGEPPLAPGWSASFNGGTASMPTADYNAIVQWRDQIAAWRDCVVAHP